jgi:type IV pilus assembly protein PilB
MRIGELLVMNGMINEDQLKEALQQQVHIDKKLGEILIENGDITELQLVEVLEFQLGIPVIHMDETVPDHSTIHLIHESTARKYGVIPIQQSGGKIKLAMVDPLNKEAVKDIQLTTGLIVQPLIATRSELEKAIIHYYGVAESADILNQIILSALEQKAKDIHFIPQEDELIIKYRIGNILHTQKTISKSMKKALVERIKIISNLNTTEQRLPQETRIRWSLENKYIDLRVSILPTINGESIVLRIMIPSENIMKMKDLTFSEENLKKVEKIINQPTGMILVSGPSNSGKTSTLYSILRQKYMDDLHIISLENPVEHHIKGITQIEVNERIGFSLTEALQSAVYRDPNILMVGDLRDKETIEIAAKASLNGCLTICGTHGISAVQTIKSLKDTGIDPHLIASSLTGIVNQRLVRRVCEQCAQTMSATDEEIQIYETHKLLNPEDQKNGKSMIGNFRTFVTAQMSGKMTVIRGEGCKLCGNTGYKGFLPIHEVIRIDETLKDFIVKSQPHHELEQYLKEQGFKSLLYDGLLKAREGLTTVQEVMKLGVS